MELRIFCIEILSFKKLLKISVLLIFNIFGTVAFGTCYMFMSLLVSTKVWHHQFNADSCPQFGDLTESK